MKRVTVELTNEQADILNAYAFRNRIPHRAALVRAIVATFCEERGDHPAIRQLVELKRRHRQTAASTPSRNHGHLTVHDGGAA